MVEKESHPFTSPCPGAPGAGTPTLKVSLTKALVEAGTGWLVGCTHTRCLPRAVINLHCHHDPLPSSEHSSRHIYVIKTRYSSRHFSLLTLGRMHYHPHLLTMKPKLREIMNPPRSDNWAAEARLKLSSAVIFCNIFFFLEENKRKEKTKEKPSCCFSVQ